MKDQPSAVEGVEPLGPVDVLEVLVVVPEVEAKDAEVVTVLGALDGGWCGVARLGPLRDAV